MATGQQRVRSRIDSIAVEGYKSLHSHTEIATPPLTVIAGVNSAGKSSIMQPLLLLKQTVDVGYDPGALLLNGPNVGITSVDQVLSRGASAADRADSFAVGISLDGKRTEIRFARNPDGGVLVTEYSSYFLPTQGEPISLHENMSGPVLREKFADLVGSAWFPESLRVPENGRLVVTRDRFALIPSIELVTGDSTSTVNFDFGATVQNAVSDVIHLPALRGNPERTYVTTAVTDKYPGRFDTYTAGVVSNWQARKDTDRLRQLNEDMGELGLASKVEARAVNDAQVELRVGRVPNPPGARKGGARDMVSIADVGFGVSQTLPVVVGLLAAGPGQLVYLEQPEIHLHPRAQLNFAQLVKRAVNRGVRVVVETHSSLFVRAVQTLVATGEMSKDDVALHWFTLDPGTGHTNVSTAELHDDGSFGEWPLDFDDVHLRSHAAYLDAAMGREEEGS